MMNRMLKMKLAQTRARTSNYDACHEIKRTVGGRSWKQLGGRRARASCRWQIRARQLGKVTWDMSQSFLPAFRRSDWLPGHRRVETGRRRALLCLRKDTITVPSRRARQRNLWSNAARYKCKSYKSPRWWLKDITVTSQPIIKQTGTIRDKHGHTLNNEPLRARTFGPRRNIRVIFH